jgi:hypothetical protein
MLHITKKETYYTVDKEAIISRIQDKTIPITPIPKLHDPSRISFASWRSKYSNEIDNILDALSTDLLKLKSERFISHINMSKLKDEFLKKLYLTSSNSRKDFI